MRVSSHGSFGYRQPDPMTMQKAQPSSLPSRSMPVKRATATHANEGLNRLPMRQMIKDPRSKVLR